GINNTAHGWNSLTIHREVKFNAAVGAGTLVFNVADNNTATSAGALLNNTTGKETRLMERSPSLATRTAISTRLLAMARFRITPLAIPTPSSGTPRSRSPTPVSTIQPSALMRTRALSLATAMSPWVQGGNPYYSRQ